MASAAAAASCFTDYRERKAPNTLRRQVTELARFADFLAAVALPAAPTAHALAHDPTAWRGVTWGLSAAFVRWLLGQGYAVGTVHG